MKKCTKNIIALCCAVVITVTAAFGAVALDRAFFREDDIEWVEPESQAIRVSLFTEPVALVHPIAQSFMDSPDCNAAEFYEQNNTGVRMDIGEPVELSYDLVGADEVAVTSATFMVADNEAMKNAQVYEDTELLGRVQIWNLNTNAQYYYKGTIVLSDTGKQAVEVSGSFKTADTPRMLNVDGLVNVRDFGGRKTVDGQRIKQNLLYRGSEMDGSVEEAYAITADGVDTMLNDLKIKTDMDLRTKHNDTGVLPLGKDVERTFYEMVAYEDCFTMRGESLVRKLFVQLADKNNYPTYLHCTYGLDRTGTMCYLLGALLGMSEEDLETDYRLSALALGRLTEDAYGEFKTKLATYEGKTLQEKTENYLLSAGVTEQEIAAIRDIYLEKE